MRRLPVRSSWRSAEQHVCFSRRGVHPLARRAVDCILYFDQWMMSEELQDRKSTCALTRPPACNLGEAASMIMGACRRGKQRGELRKCQWN